MYIHCHCWRQSGTVDHKHYHTEILKCNFDRVEAITAALASNKSLPLERLELSCKCTFTSTAGGNLAQFITNTTTLKYLSVNLVLIHY